MKTESASINLKEKDVNEIGEKIKNAKTLMVASISGLPSKQFQDIKKAIREHAEVKVAKKNVFDRALKKAGVSGLNEYLVADCAFVISELDAYELAGILAKKKTSVFAKAGQVAPEEIEVKAGPTDLVPGPAISELGALGLQVAVEDGKLSIKEDRVIIKKGQSINEGAASILMKLNIQPFSVGLNLIVAYDVADKKVYTELRIDPEGYISDLQTASGKALGFAQKIAYVCKETIGYLLAKANANANALSKFESTSPSGNKEEKVEENKNDTEDTKTEEKKDGSEEKKEEVSEEKAEENNAELNKSEEKP